jgi:hypothetical protein
VEADEVIAESAAGGMAGLQPVGERFAYRNQGGQMQTELGDGLASGAEQ